jgi:hypothetical protein
MRSPCSTRYSRCACSSRSVGPRYVWWRGLAKQDPRKARPFKRTRLSMGLSEDTFLEVKPGSADRSVRDEPPAGTAFGGTLGNSDQQRADWDASESQPQVNSIY